VKSPVLSRFSRRPIYTKIVKAMVNAAKVDGRIDEGEMKRITGNLEKDGISAQEQELLAAELREPMDTDGLVRAVPNSQVAA
jgi:uncharacterized membrane protein YebE (DUF533 family)